LESRIYDKVYTTDGLIQLKTALFQHKIPFAEKKTKKTLYSPNSFT